MSQANVEAARRVLAAVARRDLSDLTNVTDPEVQWRSFFATLSHDGEYHGHEGMRQYVRDLQEVFEWIRPEVDDVLAAGDIVVAVGCLYYRGQESGVESKSAAGWVFKFRDAKLVLFRAFRDPVEALEAVGLRE